MTHSLGIDIGSCYTKAVLVEPGGAVRASCILKTGADFARAAKRAGERCLDGERASVTSTGVGRALCAAAGGRPTELSCLARGSHHYFPRPHAVVDIGGQDNKVVRVDAQGRLVNFKMNRKCAAGTGAFLEEIARRLDIPVSRMNRLAQSARSAVEIGSYCTVFTCTEIIHHIREGKKAAEILKGCYESVVKRLLEMDPLDGDVALSGGVVANHPVIIELFRARLGREPFVPPQPQLLGAVGAALLGLERAS